MFPEHSYKCMRTFIWLGSSSLCLSGRPIWKKEPERASETQREKAASPQLSDDRMADWPHLQCQFPLICHTAAATAAAAAVHLHLCRKYFKILFAFFFLFISISPAVLFACTCCRSANWNRDTFPGQTSMVTLKNPFANSANSQLKQWERNSVSVGSIWLSYELKQGNNVRYNSDSNCNSAL